MPKVEKIPVPPNIVATENEDVHSGARNIWSFGAKAFPALESRNYRIYFAGQLVSVIGTWMQIVAQGWLVLSLTGSAFMIGVIAACATTPSLIFSLFGGVIVDRYSRKSILFVTMGLNMLLATTLGIITVTGMVTVSMIGIIAFLMGTVNSLDAPARQAFIPEIVTKDQLASAIALNSSIFNAGRIIGPGLAGFLIAGFGTGGAFILNGITYLWIIAVLRFINVKFIASKIKEKPLDAIKAGLKYANEHPVIKTLLIYCAVISIFGWSYTTIMPLIAREVFHFDAKGLGYLYTATGLGALTATYLVGAHSKKIPALVFLVGGNSLFAISILLFGFTKQFELAAILLFLAGLGLLGMSSMMTTIIQTLVKNEYRGRVMSIYLLMFFGLAPLGNIEIGYLTSATGISNALMINSIMVFLAGGILFFCRKRIREAYVNYKNKYPEEN